jgi:hypothetical protein
VPLLLTVQTAPVESTICVAEGIVVRFGEAAKTALLMQSRNMQKHPFNKIFIFASRGSCVKASSANDPNKLSSPLAVSGAAPAPQQGSGCVRDKSLNETCFLASTIAQRG